VSDRELLELAAKAAGFEVNVAKGGGCWRNDGSKIWPKWNPLTDDGDAFRLAVKLGIGVNFYPDNDSVAASITDNVGQSSEIISQIGTCGTRYAIVKVAAEIGKSLS